MEIESYGQERRVYLQNYRSVRTWRWWLVGLKLVARGTWTSRYMKKRVLQQRRLLKQEQEPGGGSRGGRQSGTLVKTARRRKNYGVLVRQGLPRMRAAKENSCGSEVRGS